MPNERKSCKTCGWWQMRKDDTPSTKGYGECRRHAPRPGIREPGLDANWPDTQIDDWCGEHTSLRRLST